MNNKLSKIKCIAIFLAGISTASIPTLAHADWSIMGLGTLGGSFSWAYDINNSGQVVGTSQTADGRSHAFITGPNGVGMTDLGTFGESWIAATDLNDFGQVVGSVGSIPDEYSDVYAFITGPNGVGITDLGTPGEVFSRAYGINNSGQVVGFSRMADGLNHPFITGPNGIGMTDLGTFGESVIVATALNDFGQVVGISTLADGSYYAFITGPNGVGMTDLGTLGGGYISADDINNSGQVVGASSITGYAPGHAFITGPNGIGMTDLGTFGGSWSWASAINDSGEAVGIAEMVNRERHSFFFSHGEMTDLSVLSPIVDSGWTSLYVTSINNNGQIVGSGIHNGNQEAFILSYISAVPEPETYAMILVGLGLLGFMARRRKESAV